MKANKFTALLLLVSAAVPALGQEYEIDEAEIYRSPLRQVLNKFSLTVSTGYGRTGYSHKLNGFYLLQTPDAQYITSNDGSLAQEYDVYSNWFNDPLLAETIAQVDSFDVPFRPIPNPVNNLLLQTDQVVFDADSLGLAFEAEGSSIPLSVSLRFNYQRFRIGVGCMLEQHRVEPFDVMEGLEELGIRRYQPNFNSTLYTRYWAEAGYRFYDFWDYSFAGELQIGKFNAGAKFNSALIQRGLFLGLGLSIEKNLSEYFRVVFKPSYDFKHYKISIPGTAKFITHKQPAFFVLLGISITFPEIPRSPIRSDHVQLKHVITDPATGRYIEVRGQPIWKRQNPKVGENYRKIWRYKNRNKRRINPF